MASWMIPNQGGRLAKTAMFDVPLSDSALTGQTGHFPIGSESRHEKGEKKIDLQPAQIVVGFP